MEGGAKETTASPVQADVSESLDTVRVAVGTLEDVWKGCKQKYLDQIKALESTVARLRSEAETLTSTNERLTKEVEDGKLVQDGLRKELEESNEEVTRLRIQAGQNDEMDVDKSPPPSSPLTSLQGKYDTLHDLYIKRGLDRDKDRSEVRRIFEVQGEKLKAYGAQIRAMGGVPCGSGGKVEMRGRKRRVDGQDMNVNVKTNMREDPTLNLNTDFDPSTIPTSPIRSTRHSQAIPASTSTPSKPPPKDVRECFTIRKPLGEVTNGSMSVSNSRENTPRQNKIKQNDTELNMRDGGHSPVYRRTPRSDKVKKQKHNHIDQPIFVRNSQPENEHRNINDSHETDTKTDEDEKQEERRIESESSWLIRGVEGTMRRQEEEREEREIGQRAGNGNGDVFDERGVVLVEESLQSARIPVPVLALAYAPPPARLLPSDPARTHTPLHPRSTHAHARTPATVPSIPKTTDRWLGGNKSRRQQLKRKDSFEDERGGASGSRSGSGGGGAGGSVGRMRDRSRAGVFGSCRNETFDSIGVRREIKMREVVLGPGNIPTDLREDQGMPDDGDDSVRYEINPDRNGGVGYAYGEVVRNKEHRKHLKGEDCDECRRYYDDTADIPIVDNAPVWRTQTDRDDGPRRQKNVDQVSRHRSKHQRNLTPPGYWQTAFPPTQQVEEWNEQADRMKADKRAQMRKEADKPDGMYRAVR